MLTSTGWLHSCSTAWDALPIRKSFIFKYVLWCGSIWGTVAWTARTDKFLPWPKKGSNYKGPNQPLQTVTACRSVFLQDGRLVWPVCEWQERHSSKNSPWPFAFFSSLPIIIFCLLPMSASLMLWYCQNNAVLVDMRPLLSAIVCASPVQCCPRQHIWQCLPRICYRYWISCYFRKFIKNQPKRVVAIMLPTVRSNSKNVLWSLFPKCWSVLDQKTLVGLLDATAYHAQRKVGGRKSADRHLDIPILADCATMQPPKQRIPSTYGVVWKFSLLLTNTPLP